MTKYQLDQYDMLLSVESFFNDNNSVWNSNAAIVATKTLLSTALDALAGQVAEQLINSKGVTVEKNRARMELENQTFIISAAICSYAGVVKDTILSNRCYYSKTQLLRFRDIELVGISTNLNNDATERSAVLADYGVTDAVLNSYTLAIESFANLLRNPREAINRRRTATSQIAKMLPEIMTLVKTRLDKNMVLLALSNPEFATTYKNLRALNNTPKTTLSLTITTLEKDTNKPIAKVKLEIAGTKISRVSGKRGYNKVMHLATGQHTISASHPDYLPLTVPFTVVKGETTELVVVMERVVGG